MKVEINAGKTPKIDLKYFGLVEDKDGAIWLFGLDGACYFSGEDEPAVFYRAHEIEKALETYGPFTVFTGSVTISN